MRLPLPLLALLALAACDGGDGKDTGDTGAGDTADTAADTDTADTAVDTDTGPVDADQDGVPEGEDCDDLDASVGPGSPEVCDAEDNDCDGATDDDAGTCPGYVALPFGGHTYLVYDGSAGSLADWDAVYGICAALGYDMVVVETADEQAFLAGSAPEVADGEGPWLGLYLENTGTWSWIDGTTPETHGYSNWADGRPLGDLATYAVTMRLAETGEGGQAGAWVDVDASLQRGVVCELNAP